MKRVGILYHPRNEAAYPLAKEIEASLSSKGVSVWFCSAWEEDTARSQLDNTDLILTIGGDGTILRAAQVAVSHSSKPSLTAMMTLSTSSGVSSAKQGRVSTSPAAYSVSGSAPDP